MKAYDVYLKQLTPQELGYRNGKLSTGAYFYISKDAIGSFFPILDKLICNDSLELKLINCDLYLEEMTTSFVYHNDKHAKENGTRDEYRIYLNRAVAPHDMYIRPNDIIILKKILNNTYIFKLLKPEEQLFEFFSQLIEDSKCRGKHALLTTEEYNKFVASIM